MRRRKYIHNFSLWHVVPRLYMEAQEPLRVSQSGLDSDLRCLAFEPSILIYMLDIVGGSSLVVLKFIIIMNEEVTYLLKHITQ